MAKKRKSSAPKRRKTGANPLAEQYREMAKGAPISRAKTAEVELLSIGGPRVWPTGVWVAIALGVVALVYVYWPTLGWMLDSWSNEPDYGHGWFVIPLAIYMCYQRSHKFPGVSERPQWIGLVLILLAILMRVGSRIAYADFLDAYSLIPAIGGAVWCLLGYRAFFWALPAIGFLFFAIPLPYQAESHLSWQLQGIATDLSTFFLRALGQPAVAEGHVVWNGQEKLVVEEACSGLRIFVGMAACAYFWAVLNDRSWVDRLILVCIAIPAAILVNAARIVLIGMLYPWVQTEGGRLVIHDLSGYLMILASFLILGAVGWYCRAVYKKVPVMTAKETLRGTSGRS